MATMRMFPWATARPKNKAKGKAAMEIRSPTTLEDNVFDTFTEYFLSEAAGSGKIKKILSADFRKFAQILYIPQTISLS
jgi:hypothetical protein